MPQTLSGWVLRGPANLGGTSPPVGATPIVVDGVMYTSGTFGYVYALDAATGREVWRYDRSYRQPRNPCLDLVNRGVALWKGRVYVAAVDGMLHAIDARTGRRQWKVDTIVDHSLPYSSTGAPIIAGDKVVSGNSGSDIGRDGVRGYVAAYNADSGRYRKARRLPPPPRRLAVRHRELATAADVELKRPASARAVARRRSFTGADSVIFRYSAAPSRYYAKRAGWSKVDASTRQVFLAVRGKTGRLAWHYQTTPHDEYDFDAVQKLVLQL
jgi:quinohemoprotein ethanol dehydrogenase